MMEYIDFRAISEEKDHSQVRGDLIDKVCDHLKLPESTFLGTRVTKKMLIDSNELSSHDKKLVTDVIQSIEWRNTLKPDTVNISMYVTDTVEYLEVAVIRVVLKAGKKHKDRLTNITKLMHTLIPYPVVLLVELQNELAISLADKRINQADKTRLVIEHIYNSDWLHPEKLSNNENDFLNDFSLVNASSLNYFELYHDFISMLIGLKASKVSGIYNFKSSSISQNTYKPEAGGEKSDTSSSLGFSEKSNEDKTALLRKLEGLEAELSSIRNKIKKETQMNVKMRLNIEAKNVKNSISKLKRSL
ncbi:hypothetical protein H4W00_001446 [Psychrobacter sp. PL19]|uniref:DUF4391 domain-containing protein n=1 Tax=Psychrobacter sp. PL19 TaxID=2760711 RepID=UPI001AE2088F